MQLGRAQLKPGERMKSLNLGLCFYCGSEKHKLNNCTEVESPDKVDIPSEYKVFYYVFSKAKATGLSPHQSYNCSIELLPNTTTKK